MKVIVQPARLEGLRVRAVALDAERLATVAVLVESPPGLIAYVELEDEAKRELEVALTRVADNGEPEELEFEEKH